MRVQVYSLRPYHDIEGYFINAPDVVFDPKHPGTYPGLEVKLVETLSGKQALAKYGKRALCYTDEVLYSQSNIRSEPEVIIWRLTGKTSREIVYGTENW